MTGREDANSPRRTNRRMIMERRSTPAPSHPAWPLTPARTSDRIKDYPSDARATLQVGRPLIDDAENEARNLKRS